MREGTTSSTGEYTFTAQVSVRILPLCSIVAVIVARPLPTAVRRPEEDTVATFASEEVHFVVTFFKPSGRMVTSNW